MGASTKVHLIWDGLGWRASSGRCREFAPDVGLLDSAWASDSCRWYKSDAKQFDRCAPWNFRPSPARPGQRRMGHLPDILHTSMCAPSLSPSWAYSRHSD
jgi:hypothetical protein